MKTRAAHLLMLCMLLFTACGANCHHMAWQMTQPAPTVFNEQPTLQQVIEVVNSNRSRVTSFSSDSATLSGSGFPSLRAKLSVGGQRRVRLTAETGITGRELDLGSNDEQFWIWIKRNNPPGVYYARHNEFAGSPAQQMMPVEPKWLIEALGLVYLDPQLPHQGPFMRGDGKLDIRTPIQTTRGQMTKVTTIDARTGWMLEQQLLDPQGQLVASAVSSRHARDPLSGVTLPRKTQVSWPAAEMNLTIELHNLEINPLDMSPDLWTRPVIDGYPEQDITRLQPTTGQQAFR